MKSSENPVKNPQNQVCAKMQKEWCCDFVTNFSHECSRSMWLLLILLCGIFDFFQGMRLLRPLVI